MAANDSPNVQPLHYSALINYDQTDDRSIGRPTTPMKSSFNSSSSTVSPIYASINFKEKHARRRERSRGQNPELFNHENSTRTADQGVDDQVCDLRKTAETTATANSSNNVLWNISTVGEYEEIVEFRTKASSTLLAADTLLRFDSDDDDYEDDEHIYEPINVQQDIRSGTLPSLQTLSSSTGRPKVAGKSNHNTSSNLWQRYVKRSRMMFDLGGKKPMQKSTSTLRITQPQQQPQHRQHCRFVTEFRKLWSNSNTYRSSASSTSPTKTTPTTSRTLSSSSSFSLKSRINRICRKSDDRNNNDKCTPIASTSTTTASSAKPFTVLPAAQEFNSLNRTDREHILDARTRFLQSCLLATDKNDNHGDDKELSPKFACQQIIKKYNNTKPATTVVLQLELRKKLAIREHYVRSSADDDDDE